MNFFIAGLFSKDTPGIKAGVNHVLLDSIWLTQEGNASGSSAP
jgi:hypothetical protein